jgi:hypothetical protein
VAAAAGAAAPVVRLPPRLGRRVSASGRAVALRAAQVAKDLLTGRRPAGVALRDGARDVGLTLDALLLTLAAERAAVFLDDAAGGHAPEDKHFREAAVDAHYDERFFRNRLAPAELIERQRALLGAFARLCERHRLDFFIMHGSLLGWVWGRRMLPWDRDIDLCVELAAMDRLVALAAAGAAAPHVLDVNAHFRDRRTRNLTARDTLEPNKIDARFIDPETGLYLDITAVAEVAPGLWATKCPHLFRAAELFPLGRDVFEGVAVGIPRRPIRLVQREYGAPCTTLTRFGGHTFDVAAGRWIPDGEVVRPGVSAPPRFP